MTSLAILATPSKTGMNLEEKERKNCSHLICIPMDLFSVRTAGRGCKGQGRVAFRGKMTTPFFRRIIASRKTEEVGEKSKQLSPFFLCPFFLCVLYFSFSLSILFFFLGRSNRRLSNVADDFRPWPQCHDLFFHCFFFVFEFLLDFFE